jgi:eukaryotic-like serine/threonine-protein kinase
MHDLSNQQLGDYNLRGEVGRGGMAIVYDAQHRDYGRVAFKVLPAHVVHDKGIVMRFMNEARAVAALVHPNIVRLYEAGSVADPWGRAQQIHYIAMEFIPGGTLADALKGQRLSLDAALDMGIDIGYALVQAHRTGFVHRDIKPSNILFRNDGHAVLADFGIAKAANQVKLTQTGSLTGTYAYMAPEVAHGHPADVRSDIYALALVIYESVTGTRPFGDDTSGAASILSNVLYQPIPPIHTFDPGVPKLIAQSIEQALDKSPARRPANAEAFVNQVRYARMGRAPSQPFIPTERPRPAMPESLGPIILVISVVLLVMLGMLWLIG